MKPLITKKIMLLAVMLLTGLGSSFAFVYEGLTYRVVDNDAKTVKVTYQGSGAYSDPYTQTSIVIPETVEFNGNTYTVVEIGDETFVWAPLQSITIPATVKTIGSYVFKECTNLTTIDLSTIENFGSNILSGCTALTSVKLPITMQSIPDGLFEGCSNITSFTFPSGVTSIGRSAFSGTGLTSITIPETVTSIGGSAFSGSKLSSISIPESVSLIGSSTFASCTSLTSVITYAHSIDDGAFRDCTNLTSVTLYAPYIVGIGSGYFFSNCDKIKTIICLGHNNLDSFGFTDNVKETAQVIVPESQVSNWTGSFLNVKAADITNVGGHVVDVLDDGMAATGGKVVVNGKMVDSMFGQAFVIEPGKDVELEFIPNNYDKLMELDKVTINGIDVTASLVNGKYTIKSISGNQLIKATWKEGVSYNVTYYANDYSCGSLYVNGKELSMYSNTSAFPANEDITLVIKPNTGYSISYFRIDAMDKKNELTVNNDGTYSYTHNLYAGTSIEIGYVKPWKLTTTFGDGGTVTVGDENVASGTTKELTGAMVEVKLIPASGYELASVLYNGTDVTTTWVSTGTDGILQIYPSSDQGDNQTLSITFQKINTTYTITYYVDGEIYKEVSYNVGDAVTPEPNPTKDNYTFSGWSTTPMTMPANNIVVTGTFTQNGGDEPVEHEYVDLGLPSGTLWATMNIGASKVEDSGDKFAWGETKSRTDHNKGNYIYYSDTFTATKYNDSDGLTELQNSDDAAYVNWGAKWRTPTKEDWIELKNSCSLSWTSKNGVNGYLVTSNSNGNTIFLPILKGEIAGRYWSATRGHGDYGAYDVAFDYGGFYIDDIVEGNEGRHNGENVRPVRKVVTSGNIDFADANVKVILLTQTKIDINGDGEISYEEAAAVTSLGYIFQWQKIVSFDELQYFTGLTSIDNDAFNGCTSLTSITIPNSVTTIGWLAFYDCSSLKLITSKILNPFDVNAFDWSSMYATLVVPKGSRDAYKKANGWTFGNILEESETNYAIKQTDEQGVRYSLRQADDNSFYYAVTGHSDDLKSEIVIPADIDGCPVKEIETHMPGGAFEGCNDLTSVKILGNQMTTIGYRSFYGCTNLTTVKMANSVRSIGGEAFSECTSLTSITLPKDLESIFYSAFGSSECDRYCPITSIHIPHSVKTIGNEAFRYCHDLALVSFDVDVDGNSALTSIGDYAFSDCSFTSITIPNSVTSIGEGAFTSNRNLTNAILSDGITEIAGSLFESCGNLASVIIPDGVTRIGGYAFSKCWNLRSIKLPESLTTMGENAFSDCQLKSIELPNSFTVIPENCFSGNNFQYIKLGKKVKSIGKNAFGSRISEEKDAIVLEIGTTTPPTLDKNAFPNVDFLGDINVIVPDATAQNKYSNAAVWEDMTFANQNNISEVTVETPGDLSYELILECGMQPAKVVDLKVNGTINADDFTQMLVNMKSLLRLDLSDCEITEIPDNAMNGKTQLQELTLPTSLQTIGMNAFKDCQYLTGELNLPSTLTSIGDYAFVGTAYTSVKLPSTLKTIGDYAFNNVPVNQKLTLPIKVTSVGAYAFAGTKITELVIRDGLTSIGDNAFADTPIQGHVTIPDGVTYLGNSAFRNTQISTVFLPNSITTLSQGLFQGCPNLNTVYVPDNYTAMSNYAFDGCGSLSILRLSANTTSMGEYTLQNTPLDYLKVPSQVEVLPRGVLKNCKQLESLTLPANLKSMEAEALYGCTALRNLSVEAVTPPSIKERSVMRGINTDKCLISIPTSAYRAYVLAEYWGQFVQMRNDIAVETEGNGEIAFESVAEEEEDEENLAPRRAGLRAPQLASDEESMTFANNGSSVYVPQEGKVRFYIIPGEGEELVSATLDGEDIMPYIVDGVYTATADKKNAKLVVKFTGQGSEVLAGDVNNDGTVDISDYIGVANHILGNTPDGFNAAAADVNNDGEIDISDYIGVANIILTGKP